MFAEKETCYVYCIILCQGPWAKYLCKVSFDNAHCTVFRLCDQVTDVCVLLSEFVFGSKELNECTVVKLSSFNAVTHACLIFLSGITAALLFQSLVYLQV